MVTWRNATESQPEPADLTAMLAARGQARSPLVGPGLIVLIDDQTWDDLWQHAYSARGEVGGMLVGTAHQDIFSGQVFLDVVGAVPALGGESTPVSFRFTSAAWDHITAERDRVFPSLITVGWYHSHPGLGIFYSGTDRQTQRAFFNRAWNIGIVIDPWTGDYGLFVGPSSDHLPTDALIIPRQAATVVTAAPTVTTRVPKPVAASAVVAPESAAPAPTQTPLPEPLPWEATLTGRDLLRETVLLNAPVFVAGTAWLAVRWVAARRKD